MKPEEYACKCNESIVRSLDLGKMEFCGHHKLMRDYLNVDC